MATRKGANRYPRHGDRIAPATLRQLLLDEAPGHLTGGLGGAVRFCDLDETVWDRLSPEVIAELSDLIVARVATCCSRQDFRRRHFPRPPKELNVAQLRLEHRTHLCLAREGFDAHPEKLGDHTIGEILDIRAFGPRCLVDLLSSLETWQASQRELDPELTREAEQLAALPGASSASRDDPRFGPLIEGIDVETSGAKELAERLIARRRDPPDPRHATEQVRQLRLRIEGLSKVALEEELIQIFASTGQERNRGILVSYYGWDDGESRTLAEVGARHQMTRERTRQICAKLIKRKNPKAIPAPVLDRTIDFIRRRLPVAVERLEKEMIDTGLTAVGLRLRSVRMSAKLLDRPIPFTVVRPGSGELAVAVQDSAIPAAVVEAAKKQVYYHGVSTVEQIHRGLAKKFFGRAARAIIVETLELIDGFSWLDDKRDWFRLQTISRHGLPKAIEKILSVAGEIGVSEIRSAVGRNRRMWQDPPPESVILEFCRQASNVRVVGDLVAADPPQNWSKTLTGVEAKLVEILDRHGPVMERGELEDLCVAGGINRFSFHAFVACSPVIRQYGHSIYGLLGANLSATQVESLAARRRAERAPQRVLDGHGRTEDGKIWLTYRLSKAASTYAVITVPAALKDTVRGRFRLLAADGRSAGTLAAKEGRAWGLGGFLRQHDAQAGDLVTITLDLEEKTATIKLGDR